MVAGVNPEGKLRMSKGQCGVRLQSTSGTAGLGTQAALLSRSGFQRPSAASAQAVSLASWGADTFSGYPRASSLCCYSSEARPGQVWTC